MNDKTLGVYKRTTHDPDETTGEALARLRATMARLLDEADVELRAQARCPDPDEHVRYDAALAAAEKAERERDEARGALRARLGVRAESRPLTPDAITDEMVKRAQSTYPLGAKHVREMLTAALTEPPARPEWADLGEALDRLWPHGIDGIAREDIARRLHTEAGVRVVGEDGA